MRDPQRDRYPGELSGLAAQLRELGFSALVGEGPRSEEAGNSICVELASDAVGRAPTPRAVPLHGPETLLERALRAIPLDFDALPLLFEGGSKVVRLWTDRVVVMRFKPTVYSYTVNRYGEAPGTETIRAQFTAALFRKMAHIGQQDGPIVVKSAFLAAIPSPQGPLIVQRRVETCNIETRIKRYHIGSPLHRYRYTAGHPTTQAGGPLKRWSRFDQPIVCFDWRHPLQDDEGNRLADEPLSDDYAGVWMDNVAYAKAMARSTFLWVEALFEAAGVRLVDMCIFIDRAGKTIYGEISPDCMRVKLGLDDPATAESADKDVWRYGGSPDQLLRRYAEIYQRVFG